MAEAMSAIDVPDEYVTAVADRIHAFYVANPDSESEEDAIRECLAAVVPMIEQDAAAEIDRLRAGQPPLTDEYGIRTVYVSTMRSEEPVADNLSDALRLVAAAKASGRTDVISREVIRREVGQWRDIEEGDERG